MNESFASRLKKLREGRGLSQSELADKLGISRGSISFYENKSRVPDIDVLLDLCNFFSVSGDYLIGLSDDPKQIPTAVQETGLSYDAIDRLNAWYTRYPDGKQGLDALSRLIGFSDFFHLMVLVQELFDWAGSDDSAKFSSHRPPADVLENARKHGYQLVSNFQFRRAVASLVKDEFGDIISEIVKIEEDKVSEKLSESIDVSGLLTPSEQTERFLKWLKERESQGDYSDESPEEHTV